MKPTNDIPTGTDLLIEKIDDLIEVIKHLTATIKKERHDISEYTGSLTADGGDPLPTPSSRVDTEGPEEICRARTVRRADPEPDALPMPMPEAPCYSDGRTEADTNISVGRGTWYNPDSSTDRGTWCSDITYSDLTYSTATGSTTISRSPRSYSLNGIRCGIDMGENSAGRDCRSTEVSNARG